MKKHWAVGVFEVAILLMIIIAGFGSAVLQLWNWLMPEIFGLQRINFWQAVGLLGLSWILFGQGFLGRPAYGTHWRQRMRDRWSKMTPEEWQKFQVGMRRHCGPVQTPPMQPKV
jgi:hypothetical protein